MKFSNLLVVIFYPAEKGKSSVSHMCTVSAHLQTHIWWCIFLGHLSCYSSQLSRPNHSKLKSSVISPLFLTCRLTRMVDEQTLGKQHHLVVIDGKFNVVYCPVIFSQLLFGRGHLGKNGRIHSGKRFS